MRSTQTILVPVDGSDASTRALEYAVDRVAMADKGSLVVFNVQLGMPASRYVSREMIAEHQHRLAGAALEAARALLKRRKLEADVGVLIGDPAATIVKLAKRRGRSEIVMGSRGRGRVTGMLLGSVASKVIQLAPCPVTIVK
ncbi:universal stress protein [Peristeroidobacter agariperforans]|uniref:universal stress protein n=1 Tax=Peristeroidobacter agariperforans TaxID=268404 RepID=UPI00101B8F1E|nr:universal stress protein [Peristeroidobacter agariperforans]